MSSQKTCNQTRRRLVALAGMGGIALAGGRTAFAADYPTGPVKIVVPFPPGGTVDTLGRVIGPAIGTAINQQVIIENKGGAGATIGANLIAQSAPNGYTILLNAANQIITPLIAMTLYLGVYPAAVFDLTQASVDSLAAAYQAAIGG